MPRMTGESAAEYAARLRFKKLQKEWAKADEIEREKMRAVDHKPLVFTEIDPLCSCSRVSFRHVRIKDCREWVLSFA